MASTSAEIPAAASGTADQPVGRVGRRATATRINGGLAETTLHAARPAHAHAGRVRTGIRRAAG